MQKLNQLIKKNEPSKKVFVCSSYSVKHDIYGDKYVTSSLEKDIRYKLLR